ncbi:hypothetical protein LCGC14_2511760 [marine sediment metagenome]|uniref:Uncharacterized protein n=1 Tax=marine sediment metagenome TaxID=412755 RepID=A0A0F9BLU1_9ZZZZ
MAFPESATVSSGDDILATDHNNMRTDMLSNTVGHDHDGTANHGTPIKQIDSTATFDTPYTQRVMIGFAAFRPNNDNNDWLISGDQEIFNRTTVGGLFYYADVGGARIPDGANIQGFNLYFVLDDVNASITAVLFKSNLATGTVTSIAVRTQTGLSAGRGNTGETNPAQIIDYTTNVYFVRIQLIPNAVVTDARIVGTLIKYVFGVAAY